MVNVVKQNFKKNKILYNKTKQKLKKQIGHNIEINHVGSTAIPNMYGKNIIDILIGVKDKDEFEYVNKVLKDMGYISSDKSKTDIYQFFSSTNEETKSGDIHIHLVFINTERYLEFIILRNYLLKNKNEANAYSNFKRELVSNNITDRKEYKEIKSKYVAELLKRAITNYQKEKEC